MVEIMKAYRRNPKVIAFDEPTASLSDAEIDAGVALINQAQVLLDAWKFWGNK